MSMLPSHENDTENPEGTTAEFAKATTFSGLSDGLCAKLSVRGTQKAPIKERITMRLSMDVVARIRAIRTRMANAHRRGTKGMAGNAPSDIDKSGNS
jgi:hypothetical protein